MFKLKITNLKIIAYNELTVHLGTFILEVFSTFVFTDFGASKDVYLEAIWRGIEFDSNISPEKTAMECENRIPTVR